MITIGEILSRERLRKNLMLEQVEKATKIRLKFLVALEKDEFNKLPPGTFTKGLIKNYSAYLGLSVEDSMAFYRRQVDEEKFKVSPSARREISGSKFRLTPQIFTIVSIGFLLACFFGYLIFSYFQFAGAPSLTVDQPKNNIVVNLDQVEVAGKIDPDANLVINGQAVTVDEKGKFNLKIPLDPGLNAITLTATNKFKKQSTVVRNVRLEK